MLIPHTLLPRYITVRYNMISDTTQFFLGPQIIFKKFPRGSADIWNSSIFAQCEWNCNWKFWIYIYFTPCVTLVGISIHKCVTCGNLWPFSGAKVVWNENLVLQRPLGSHRAPPCDKRRNRLVASSGAWKQAEKWSGEEGGSCQVSVGKTFIYRYSP